MPTRIIRQPEHVAFLVDLLSARKMPITVTWTQGAPRKGSQNRLAQRWYSDIANQLGDDDRETVRATCKLRFGVPMLRAENEAFRISYDRALKHLSYEEKVEAIKAFDLPVTRLMLTKQMSSFMDQVHREYSNQGVHLTNPDDLKYQFEFQDAYTSERVDA